MNKEWEITTRFGARPLNVEVISSYEGFRALGEEWDQLCAQAVESVPMNTHDWLDAWWRSFAVGSTPHVILVRRGDRLIGAAPFLYARKKVLNFNCRVVRPWVNSWVDRFTFLFTEPSAEVIEAIFHQLDSVSSNWDFIELPRLEENSMTATLIREVLNRRSFPVGIEEDIQSPYLRLPESWDELLQGLSTSFRQNVRRKLRAFEKVEQTHLCIRDDDACIEPLVEISLESWQHDGRTSIASRPEIRSFYSRIVEDWAAKGDLRCAVLTVGGEPAAFELNLKHRSVLHNLKLGFKKKFADLSTGIILKAFVMQQALNNASDGIEEYDFMGIAERYKLQWAKTVREHQTYVVFADRPGPRLIHRLLYVAKPAMRDRFPESFALLKKSAGFLKQAKNSLSAGAGLK